MYSFNQRQKEWWCKRFGSHFWYDCDEVLGRKPLDVKIWHQDRLDAAHVMKLYLERALERSFGEDYNISVEVRKQSLPDSVSSSDDVFGYFPIEDDGSAVYDEMAKDANLALLPHADSLGGGSACVSDADTPFDSNRDIGDLRGEEHTFYEQDRVYAQISSAIHEVGHCLGLGHDVGGRLSHEGKQYVSVMPYDSLESYYLGYHPDISSDKLTVQDSDE